MKRKNAPWTGKVGNFRIRPQGALVPRQAQATTMISSAIPPPPCSGLHRQNTQRRKACRPPRRTADEIQAGSKSQDGQSARYHLSAVAYPYTHRPPPTATDVCGCRRAGSMGDDGTSTAVDVNSRVHNARHPHFLTFLTFLTFYYPPSATSAFASNPQR
jgi:hypothetical protein